jgi:coenzyme PQQ synthesis protein D (PqqD)
VKTSDLDLQQPVNESGGEHSVVRRLGFENQATAPVKRRDDLMLRRVQNELLFLDMESKQIHQLNETASFIWDMWNQVPNTREIAKLLVQRFDVEEHVALSDVSGMVDKLRDLKLLVG